MLLYVRFRYVVQKVEYWVSFKVPVPKAEDRTPKRGFKRSAARLQKLQEQYKRGIWRAVFWAIKSRLESVEFGIETFQEAFLSHFEIPGTKYQIGEVLIPKLKEGNLRLLEH